MLETLDPLAPGTLMRSLAVPACCLWFDNTGTLRILAINPPFSAAFGKPAHQLVGRRADDLIRQHTGTLQNTCRNCLENGDAACEKAEIDLPSGSQHGDLVVTSHKQDGVGPDFALAVFVGLTPVQAHSTHPCDSTDLTEAFYRAIVETQIDLIVRYTPDLILSFCNRTYAEFHGLEPKDMIGRSILDWLSADEAKALVDDTAAMVACGAPRQNEIMKTMPDGTERWYRWTNVAIRDAAGKITAFQSVGHEITDRRQIERDLQASDHRLRLAIDSMQDGFALFDPQDRLLIYNKPYTQLALAPTTDPVGKTFEQLARATRDSDIAPAEAKQDPEAWLQKRLERHRNPPLDPVEVPIHDGRWLRVSERRTPDGSYVGIWSDITPLKHAENRLAQAIAAINEGFVLYDADERLVLSNDRLLAFFPGTAPIVKPGASLEDMLRYGALHGDFPDVGGDIEAFVQDMLTRSRVPGYTVDELRAANGRWLHTSKSPVADGGFVGVLTDITKLKQREDELTRSEATLQEQAKNLTELAGELLSARVAAEAASQAKSRFLAHMSHELRTPLNAILGFADVIREGMFGTIAPARYVEYVQHIHDSGSHLLEMINDILDLSKIEAGRLELNPVFLNARETAEAGSKLVLGLARDTGVAMRMEVADDDLLIYGDARAIKQIIINLLSNAVKFTPASGLVTLAIRPRDILGIDITVIDTGIGMTEKDIDNALDPYGQVESTRARKHPGSGLGLTIVKNLAEMQGGHLEIDSEPGRGTRVTVFLPLPAPCPN
jgi:PAS domain S-box-containing protein